MERSPTRGRSRMWRPPPATRPPRRRWPAGSRQSSCSDGSPVSSIDVAPAENVTCTFVNKRTGTIVAVKDSQPNDPQDFSFTAGGGLSPASFALDDDSDGTLSNSQTFTQRRSGHRLLPRRVDGRPAGTCKGATCSDGSPVSNIDLASERDRHLHLHQPQARRDRAGGGLPAERPAGLLVHGRGRALPDELPARRRLRPGALEHAHVRQPRARLRLHAGRGRARRLGPDLGDVRQRQPARATSRWPRGKPSRAP